MVCTVISINVSDLAATNSPQTVTVFLGVGAILVPGTYSTIQAAINAADAHHVDTIIVSPGTYFENINFNGKNIILTSMDPEDMSVVENTIIDGGNNNLSVVTFSGSETPDCVLQGFTITNGYGYYGGGIRGNGTHAKIENCLITGNTALGAGGGLKGCHGPIANCIISDNITYDDCGMCDCWSYGGGLSECGGPITNCIVAGNKAYGRDVVAGGGLSACSGPITNCTIVGNSTELDYVWTEGAGGGLSGCSGSITNSVIWGNRAGDWGDQLYGDQHQLIAAFRIGPAAARVIKPATPCLQMPVTGIII